MVKKVHIIKIPIDRPPEIFTKEINDNTSIEEIRESRLISRGRIFTVEHFQSGGVLITEHKDGINWINIPKRIFLNKEEARLLAQALLDGSD